MAQMEDGRERSMQLAVGALVVGGVAFVAYRQLTGQPLWSDEPSRFSNSVPQAMLELLIFMLTTIGGLVLGLGRAAWTVLQGLFLGGGSDKSDTYNEHNINVHVPAGQVATAATVPVTFAPQGSGRVAGLKPNSKEAVIFRVDDQGRMVRDPGLEKHVCGPQTPEEILQDTVDAMIAGDRQRVDERFAQLHPGKTQGAAE